MLSQKYRQALDFAAGLHHGHMRKGTEIDYLSHLLSVSALVMEHGGSEDEAIAGLEFPGFSGDLAALGCELPQTGLGLLRLSGCGDEFDCRWCRCSRLCPRSPNPESCRCVS